MSTVRSIQQVIRAQATSDGDGVKITRIANFNRPQSSPFLMIDEFKSDQSADYIGGFPPHPHRGIETLTYMKQGHFQHKDHMGNVGELRSGGAQWMAAGRGVIHSEMPIMQEGQLHGFQIWINQLAKDKMTPARYHDFQPETMTDYQSAELGTVRLIAGHLKLGDQLLTGPLTETGVPVTVADWQAIPNQVLTTQVAKEDTVMVYVYQGSLNIDQRSIKQGEMALLNQGEVVQLHSKQASGALLFVGQPIAEPVVHYGPFVMNTREEIDQAIRDYNQGKFEHY